MMRIALVALWLVCFGSFAAARGRQFTGNPTLPMRLTVAAGLVVSLGQLAALLLHPVRWTAGPAAVLYLAAWGLFYWSSRATGLRPLALAFAEEAPSHMVVTGPYRFVRHPYYLSYLLFWTAGTLAMQTIWAAPPLLLMALLYHHAAKHEEARFDESDLADDYGAYRRRTGRFWPRIGRSMAATMPEKSSSPRSSV